MNNQDIEDKAEHISEMNSKEKNHLLKVTLLNSPEGRILLAGIILSLIYTIWLGFKLLFSPEDYKDLIGMTSIQFVLGRAAGMAFGYAQNLGHSTIIPICIIIETIMVLLLYPMFVFSWRHLLVIKWLKNIFDRTQKAAEKHKDKVQRYGIIGLFIFVWIPFWMTGPVVGCIIGFLLGINVWINITIVLLGTVVAVFGWAFFMHQFLESVASYGSYVAIFLMVALIIVIGHYLHRTLQENKNKS